MSSAEKRFFVILFSVITVVVSVFIGLFLYGKISSETRAEARHGKALEGLLNRYFKA